MNKIYKALLVASCCASSSILATTTVNFSAFSSNTFGDSSNDPLAIGSLLQVGTYDTGVFTTLSASTIGQGAGFAGGISFTSAAFDTTALGTSGNQLAIRFFNSTVEDLSDYGLVYFDGTQNSEWLLKETSLGPTPNQNQIDLGDLTDPSGLVLSGNAIIVRGDFGPGADAGFTLLQTSAVPESSTYASIVGIFALGAVITRRRRV